MALARMKQWSGLAGINAIIDYVNSLSRTVSGGGAGINQLTGDVTAGPGTGSQAATLANSGVSAGSYTSADITVDAKGRVTAAANGGSVAPALVFLEKHIASSSASLDFTSCITSAYDVYEIVLTNIVPATDNVALIMRVSTNGGSSYDSGSNYASSTFGVTGTPFSGAGGNTSGTSMVLHNQNIDTTISQNSFNGSFRLYNPLSASLYKQLVGMVGSYGNDGNFYLQTAACVYKSATAVNAFQFLMTSGNIASGTIRVYGVSN